jgi:hypothetical protein
MRILRGVSKREKFVAARLGEIFRTDNRQEILFAPITFKIDGSRRL